MKRPSTFLYSALSFGFAFLYIPIFVLMAYSFNDSRLATVWGGFSTRWYSALLDDEQILGAALLSLEIAVISATLATVLGTLAGLALNRMGRYRGRTLFTGMIAAPLVMPEVITGLSLLLLFVSLQELTGWPSSRGANTITIAHITFSMAYVAVIVQSRLASMDHALEEAAMDLGATRFRTFLRVTGPMLLPAIAASAMLIFPWSFDDFVITYFVAGIGSTTLPIYVFSQLRFGATPVINTIGTLFVVLTMAALALMYFVQKKNESI